MSLPDREASRPAYVHRDRPRLPSTFHRRVVWLDIGLFLLWLAVLPLNSSVPYGDVLRFGGLPFLGLSFAALELIGSHLSRAIILRHNGIVCIHCSYPLDTVTGDRCPECGQPFTADDTRRRWVLRFPDLRNEPWAPKDLPPLPTPRDN